MPGMPTKHLTCTAVWSMLEGKIRQARVPICPALLHSDAAPDRQRGQQAAISEVAAAREECMWFAATLWPAIGHAPAGDSLA